MTKTAVIYARYSSDSQSEQSIEGQLRVCNEYAKNNDILVLNTYIDRAMTGTNDNRPNFQQMLKDSNKKQWNYVLIYKFDRFSRNKYETAIHKKTLRDNGIKIISATEYVPDTPEGIILESMLEGYAEYYSAELSQKVKRGMRETRLKGNFTGGNIIYGYKVENHKVIINQDQADVIKYIYEQYAQGEYVKDIITKLTTKGILNNNKPFARNTIYNLLKNEKYSGIYRYKDEIFTNIYPPIVDTETFNKVRAKVLNNRYGKRSEDITYLLREKMICGYCGMSIVGENGTARNGERKCYYKCRGRKANLNDCDKQAIRKDVLEKIVLESIAEHIHKSNNIDYLVNCLMKEQERQSQANVVLNLLLKEKRTTENSINNIMNAIENGGTSNTAMKRMRELESRQSELERQIVIERSKKASMLNKDQIKEFYTQALLLEPKLLINYLVMQIVLFDDKIQIQFNSPIPTSPDNDNRGFSLCSKKVKVAFKVPFRTNLLKYEFDIEIFV